MFYFCNTAEYGSILCMGRLIIKVASYFFIFLAWLGLAGCTPPPIQTHNSFNIVIQENQFSPDTLFVNTDSEIDVSISNETSESHDWIILVEPYFSPYRKGETEPYLQVSVPAGETLQTSFISPSTAIQLDIVCENEDCVLAGMRARLIVVEK